MISQIWHIFFSFEDIDLSVCADESLNGHVNVTGLIKEIDPSGTIPPDMRYNLKVFFTLQNFNLFIPTLYFKIWKLADRTYAQVYHSVGKVAWWQIQQCQDVTEELLFRPLVLWRCYYERYLTDNFDNLLHPLFDIFSSLFVLLILHHSENKTLLGYLAGAEVVSPVSACRETAVCLRKPWSNFKVTCLENSSVEGKVLKTSLITRYQP